MKKSEIGEHICMLLEMHICLQAYKLVPFRKQKLYIFQCFVTESLLK